MVSTTVMWTRSRQSTGTPWCSRHIHRHGAALTQAQTQLTLAAQIVCTNANCYERYRRNVTRRSATGSGARLRHPPPRLSLARLFNCHLASPPPLPLCLPHSASRRAPPPPTSPLSLDPATTSKCAAPRPRCARCPRCPRRPRPRRVRGCV